MDFGMRRIGIILLAALLAAGCSTPWSTKGPAAPDSASIVIEPPIDEVRVESLPRTPLPRPLPPVAIVLSGNQPAYADVAAELKRRFERYQVYDLEESGEAPVTVLRLVNDSNPGAVVAIGLRAARSSVAMSESPVVFSQVFNYRANDLLTDNSRGIAVLPPLDAQLAEWKRIDPTIARIGIIVGEGHDDLITEAELAAQEHGVDLRVRITHSDQETLYFFRRMIRDIDGFWLFPDNRVLSARVLQQMLEEARRQQVPVNVPSESMLSHGAIVSMSSLASDIAETIVNVVRQIQDGNLARIPPITQLSEMRVRTNDTAQVVRR
jgi:ABC-type uncharacterized transport system substrate-binding protein